MKATVFELLHNYEQFGDEVVVENGEITMIVAGKRNGTVTDSQSTQCHSTN